MSIPVPPSVAAAKNQAKRLRSVLEQRGVKLGHSEALEVLAGSYGFLDWNTFSAILDQPKDRLYLGCCRVNCVQRPGEESRTAYFSFITKATSPEHFMAICEREFCKFPTNDNPFRLGDQVSVEKVVELDDIPKDGIVFDLKYFVGDHGFFSNIAPLSQKQNEVTCYDYGEEDEDGTWTPPDPIVVIGNTKG